MEGRLVLAEITPANGTNPISAAFGSACGFVIDRCEGGDALVHDSGGATRFGISQNANPDLDIVNMTRPEAMSVYLVRYWRVIHGDALPRGLDLAVFDAGVNMGCAPAIRLLQRVLRIAEDGMMGPDTLTAIRSYKPLSELITEFTTLRLRSYEALVAKNSDKFAQYLRGWRIRSIRVAVEAGRLCGNS